MAMPSKSQIFEHWMKWLDKKGYDWGEPSCWACGRFWWDRYDIKNPSATRKEIIKNWSGYLYNVVILLQNNLAGVMSRLICF